MLPQPLLLLLRDVAVAFLRIHKGLVCLADALELRFFNFPVPFAEGFKLRRAIVLR